VKKEHDIAQEWFTRNDWQPHKFQRDTWDAITSGYSGLLNAPTGFGKTYAIWFGVLQSYFAKKKRPAGLHSLWLTPLRALSKEIYYSTQRVSDELGLDYDIALRTGDTPQKERVKQKKKMPHGMITTPESVHLLLAQKDYTQTFKNLEFVVVDEWHELLGTKRGVLIELALARLKALNPKLKVWGISATIGNIEEAKDILLGTEPGKNKLIRSNLEKKIEIETLLPDEIETYPWAGHLGIKLLDKILPVIHNSNTTLIFTNVRSQCEIWYQRLLDADPSLAGQIAIHHGSLGEEVRLWVENALHDGLLKAVVCTSSLDLGVDFRPVDTVIQIGSPKGVARFMQRAGRSGHQPGAISKIYFLPTHSLEIIEGSAMRYAIAHKQIEQRVPYIRSFDVLIQFMVTLAISDGFRPDDLYREVIKTHCFESITLEEFSWCLAFITKGGKSLDNYDEFHKVVVVDGVYRVLSRKVAMRHRLNIGVIVSDSMLHVKYLGGKKIGMVEEWFLSRMSPGDVFWFAGLNLELIRIKDMTAFVRKSPKGKGVFPSWQGGRMSLSSQLTDAIRLKLDEYYRRKVKDVEQVKLIPLFERQEEVSHLPDVGELLIEKAKTQEGYHVFIYSFEGRNVHEGLSALLAYRIAKNRPMTFSLGFNDYGFELLSDQEIPIEEALANGLFNTEHLLADIYASVNIVEMARRKFRDIATISGLVISNYPGKQTKTRHIQANSELFFKVFEDYEKDNLLLQEAYEEVMTFQMEQVRLMKALERMQKQKIVIKELSQLSPFCFPIFAERFREKLSNEPFEVRVRRLIDQERK